ncbi:MAG TPA: SDR family NAD(P)-dependent oxidoreductase [Anaerolineales bacterium]|nr:SDR family NAD(P)-dependent oxidoreductase [Anaerolineales bacterium]
MDGRVFVVTGATSGIGKRLALDLAKTGETVVIVARDPDRGSMALKEVALNTENPNIDLQLCDLSILSSVRNLAEILKSRYEKIDVLINNAGVYRRKRAVTVEGFEEMFAANHLGPFLLTNLLLEWLQTAAQANGSARILNVTAPSTIELNFDDLQSGRNFNALKAFGATKMANLLFTFALARRLENTRISANAIHPGLARSGLMKESFAPLRFISWLLSNPPAKVTESIVQAATAPEFNNVSGKFLHKGRTIEAPAYAYDREVQERLWDISESLTELSTTKGLAPANDI